MIIRKSGLENIDLLTGLAQQLIEDEDADVHRTFEEAKERMTGFINGRHEAFLFEVDGDVVGYALVDVSTEPMYIKHFLIERKFRRKGYGREAFHALRKELGVEPLQLDVYVWNERAQKFYESIGFKKRCFLMQYPYQRKDI